MRLLYLQQMLILPGQAGNGRSWDLVQRWTALGHHITIVTSASCLPPDHPWRRESFPLHKTKDGVGLIIFAGDYQHQYSFPRRVWAFWRFYRQLWRYRKRFPSIDTILAYSAPLSVIWAGKRLAEYLGKPLFLELGDVWPEVPIGMGLIRPGWLRNWLHRKTDAVYRRASGIFPFSDDMARQVEARGVAPKQIYVSYNGVDPARFPRHAKTPTRKLIYTGTFGLANGLSQLIEALAWVRDTYGQEISCDLVGSGNEEALLKALAQEKQLQQLKFLPAVSKEAIPAHLAGAQIGISCFAPFPVLQTNSATKFYEYLAAGLPVILNYGGWQAGYLRSHDCGLAVPQGDIQAFGQAIYELSQDERRCAEMGTRARQLALAHFDRQKLAAEMMDKMKVN
ncbi:MAG: glycosyltransferase family 4 protein [Bacteroidota bacterium]